MIDHYDVHGCFVRFRPERLAGGKTASGTNLISLALTVFRSNGGGNRKETAICA